MKALTKTGYEHNKENNINQDRVQLPAALGGFPPGVFNVLPCSRHRAAEGQWAGHWSQHEVFSGIQ